MEGLSSCVLGQSQQIRKSRQDGKCLQQLKTSTIEYGIDIADSGEFEFFARRDH